MASSRKTVPNLWQGGSPTSNDCFLLPQKIFRSGDSPYTCFPREQVLAPAPVQKKLIVSNVSWLLRFSPLMLELP